MVVRRGALRYWPGEGLEPIPNECPFLGYPAECCVRDALPGLQGPKFSSIKTNAICPPVDGRFDPLSVSFSEVWRAPNQVSTVILYYRSRQPMLCRFGTCGPTTATGIWLTRGWCRQRCLPDFAASWCQWGCRRPRRGSIWSRGRTIDGKSAACSGRIPIINMESNSGSRRFILEWKPRVCYRGLIFNWEPTASPRRFIIDRRPIAESRTFITRRIFLAIWWWAVCFISLVNREYGEESRAV